MSSAKKKQHQITKLQGDVVFRRGITLGHPQPATDDPMNCSLASNVVSSWKVAKPVSIHLHPSPPVCFAADEQSTKGREYATLEMNVWNLREVVMTTKGCAEHYYGKRTRRMTRTSVAQHSGGRELNCEWRDGAIKGFAVLISSM